MFNTIFNATFTGSGTLDGYTPELGSGLVAGGGGSLSNFPISGGLVSWDGLGGSHVHSATPVSGPIIHKVGINVKLTGIYSGAFQVGIEKTDFSESLGVEIYTDSVAGTVLAHPILYLDGGLINIYETVDASSIIVDGYNEVEISTGPTDRYIKINGTTVYTITQDLSVIEDGTFYPGFTFYNVSNDIKADSISTQLYTASSSLDISNRLVKSFNPSSFTPGTPSTQGQAYVPSYTYIKRVPVYTFTSSNTSTPTTTTTSIQQDDITKEYGFFSSTTGGPSYYVAYKDVQVFVPETPFIAPTLGTAGTDELNANLGWNSGARSKEIITGNGSFSFNATTSSSGIVAGLNDINTGSGYLEIDFGFYFNSGLFQVYEKGAARTAAATFTSSDRFTVERINNTVNYLKNETIVYTSLQASSGVLFADTSMYASGDTLFNAQLSTRVASVVDESNASLLPFTGLSSDYDYAESNSEMLPFIGQSAGFTLTASNAVLPAFVGVSSNYNYSSSSGELLPLQGVSSSGLLTPTYAAANVSLPYLLGSSTGLTGGVGSVNASLEPFDSLSANYNYSESNASLPAFAGFSAYFPPLENYAVVSTPSGYRSNSSGNELAASDFTGARVTLGSVQAYGYFQGIARVRTPAVRVLATGEGQEIGRINIKTPRLRVRASGVAMEQGQVRVSVGSVRANGYFGGQAIVRTTRNNYEVLGSGVAFETGSIQIKTPSINARASGADAPSGIIKITLPSVRLVGSSKAKATLGSIRAFASGYESALVVYQGDLFDKNDPNATLDTALIRQLGLYEGYAVNLKSPAEIEQGASLIRQVSHYTDYPFNQIVRLGNKYYGVASDGLYELGGTTFDGASINWSFKTGLSTLGTDQFKTLINMYVNGRLVNGINPVVYPGEDTENGYSYGNQKTDSATRHRVVLGAGVRSNYFGFGMSGSSSQRVQIDSIDIEMHTKTRSIS